MKDYATFTKEVLEKAFEGSVPPSGFVYRGRSWAADAIRLHEMEMESHRKDIERRAEVWLTYIFNETEFLIGLA